jgi:hypothetical protein
MRLRPIFSGHYAGANMDHPSREEGFALCSNFQRCNTKKRSDA